MWHSLSCKSATYTGASFNTIRIPMRPITTALLVCALSSLCLLQACTAPVRTEAQPAAATDQLDATPAGKAGGKGG
jgi:hypothetical protein